MTAPPAPEQSSGADRLPRAGRLGVAAVVVVLLAALAVTVGVGLVNAATAPTEEVAVADESDTPADSAPDLYVHVAGAVATPGLYVLPRDSRLVDAIAAAGGFAADADTAAVNLARPLSDGEQLHVPRVGESDAVVAGGTPDGLVNLNTADAGALEELPRIGPALADRIIAWREANGRFTSVEDLLAVSGIGDRMLESLRDLVTV